MFLGGSGWNGTLLDLDRGSYTFISRWVHAHAFDTLGAEDRVCDRHSDHGRWQEGSDERMRASGDTPSSLNAHVGGEGMVERGILVEVRPAAVPL